MKIAIIDYGLGNVKSVANALSSIDIDCVLTADHEEIKAADALIMPGVGAFGDGMKNIHAAGLFDVISSEVNDNKKPLLGICLGMQLLADGSDEFGEHKGFGFIPGWVRKMEPSDTTCKIPHIGWNDVEVITQEPLLREVGETPDYYFVHSYHFAAENDNDVSAWCDHGMRFAAVVQKDHVMGAQFHPEKSQRAGITLLKNFCEFVGSC